MYPEAIEQIRHLEPVQPARGGRITRVIVRLSNGRAMSFYEVAINGCIVPCDTLREAFDACREIA